MNVFNAVVVSISVLAWIYVSFVELGATFGLASIGLILVILGSIAFEP